MQPIKEKEAAIHKQTIETKDYLIPVPVHRKLPPL
jgi:hypothetical protein